MVATRTRSSDTAIATMVGQYLVARAVGSIRLITTDSVLGSTVRSSGAPITVTGPGTIPPLPAPGVLSTPRTLMRVNVRTVRQATNMLMSEVCANVDSTFFEQQQYITSHLPRIHEYHDCQKLIERGGYSAVVGIFASSNVDSSHPPVDPDGYLAAIIVNFIGNKTPTTYNTLGLRPGTNCLMIRSLGRVREAAIVFRSGPTVPAGTPSYGDCPDNLKWSDIPREQRVALVVREQKGVDLQNRPIAPSVARWDWDPEHRYNYIGVKCDTDTWCEIGPAGFVPSVAATTPDSNPIFKGYYDEQFLAADTFAVAPSSVWGTLLPGADATDKSQMAGRDTKRWYETATVRLAETRLDRTQAYHKYVATLSADLALPTLQTTPGRRATGAPATLVGFPGTTTLYREVAIPATPSNAVVNAPAPLYSNYKLQPRDTAAFWLGYVGMMRSSRLKDHAVHFMYHQNQMSAPTVRWRWKANDEGLWSFCEPDGCCEAIVLL